MQKQALAILALAVLAGCQQVSLTPQLVKTLEPGYEDLKISEVAIMRPTTTPQAGGKPAFFRDGLYQVMLNKKYSPISLQLLDNQAPDDLSPQELAKKLGEVHAILKSHLLSWNTRLYQGQPYLVTALRLELFSREGTKTLWSAHLENLWVPQKPETTLQQLNEEVARIALESLPDRPVHSYKVQKGEVQKDEGK